jgi:hypothetical protein
LLVEQAWLLPHQFASSSRRATQHISSGISFDTSSICARLATVTTMTAGFRRTASARRGVVTTTLLLYAYTQGGATRRGGIARSSRTRVDLKAVTAMQQADQRIVGDFRRRRLDALATLC